jgi:hypothetical protein
MPIPYVFIWTPKYEIFADVLKKGIKIYPELEDKSIFIPQEFFDAHSNKAPGHLMTGCSLKLLTAYEMLKTLPEDSYFIFSDADIILFPGKPLMELLNVYIRLGADCVFMRETMSMEFYNVGFSLLRVNQINRDLFLRALKKYESEPNGLDGSFINDCLKDYAGTCFYFPPELVATTSSVIDMDKKKASQYTMRTKIIVFQALCDAHKSSEQMIKQKLEQYKILEGL